MQQVPDPYRLLGVTRGASEAQIKAAHRTLAKRYHPDSPSGDTVRFLQVQEAYDLLLDPLRRREWDARHAGPMAASQAPPPRPRAANGRWTRSTDAGGPRPGQSSTAAGGSPEPERASAPGRETGPRGYTWSASEVPWWEDHGPRESRRQPGRQRPREPERAPEAGQPRTEAPHDFDVYNRSSGAAWSSAARAYFRRGDSELPRRGSFQRQGTQPLTAARARAAAEEARRTSGQERRPPRSDTPPRADPRPPRADPRPPSGDATRPPAEARRAGAESHVRRPSSAERPRSQQHAGPPQPAYAWAGVTREAPSTPFRARAREADRAARWPSLSERLAYALLAWLPIAILIGYAGSVVTGCDRAAVGCPANFEVLQSVLIALALVALVALPRAAYVGAFGAAGLIIGTMAIALGAWFAGITPPLPPPAMIVAGVVLAIAYLATASWALADGPRRRPWAVRSRRTWNAGR